VFSRKKTEEGGKEGGEGERGGREEGRKKKKERERERKKKKKKARFIFRNLLIPFCGLANLKSTD
jgi:hypothetical protein